ncbi:MAG: hypothetical protein EBS36_04485 [Actinobacteria bacterium]|nr:hypothetical protein [Actinomycetota bacterium]NBY15422.1 hypothetical protein [Actinomycetota bacterium]
MRSIERFSKSIKVAIAGISLVGGLLATAIPASAITTAPDLSTMDKTIVGSGSDTTYDLMMALDKVYNAANGCATIWASSSSQPRNGQCDTSDQASGNGSDKSSFPWVNDSHAVIKELYPVGSGAGQTELCKQAETNTRQVDFARSSSGPATSTTAEKCSDLKYIAYAEDAVTWYHFTKNPDGSDTASSRIDSIDTDTLKAIFRGEVTLWSQLNGNAGVLDVDGKPFATASPAASNEANPLPATGIVLYTTQSNSGTYSYWTNSARTNSATKMSAPAASPVPSQTAPAIYSTVQENFPAAIKYDGNTNNAIYFMSVGRYKQTAGITDQENAYSSRTATGSKNAGGYEDALGKINGIAPTIANIAKGADKTSGYFPFSRDVYNVTRYASAATNAYVGPSGFLCTITDTTKDRIKQVGYRSLIESAIKSEGFAPLPVSAGSYCRVRNPNTAVTPNDATAPTVTLASPSPSANTAGEATFTINFSEPVRMTDASKLTVTQTGNSSLVVSTTATNSKGVAVSAFDAGNTNDLDPYANKVVSNIAVKVTGIAYDGDGSKPVSLSLAAGAAADRAGNSTAAFSASVLSNTPAADTTAPVITVDAASKYATTLATGIGSFILNFSEPVREVDLSKFHVIKNVANVAPVEILNQAPLAVTSWTNYSCTTVKEPTVWGPCNFWANNQVDNPNGLFAVTAMTVRVKASAITNASLAIDAGAFKDAAGNASAARIIKKNINATDSAASGTWTASGSDFVSTSANASRTQYIFGTSVTVVLGKDVKGGKVSVLIDGVQYAVDPTLVTGNKISWDLNGSGTATVAVTGLANGYHTVVVKNLGKSPTATGTTSEQNTFTKVTVKSIS